MDKSITTSEVMPRMHAPGIIGFGSAPLGNMYRNIPEQEALDTVESAWQQGIRYFAAPHAKQLG